MKILNNIRQGWNNEGFARIRKYMRKPAIVAFVITDVIVFLLILFLLIFGKLEDLIVSMNVRYNSPAFIVLVIALSAQSGLMVGDTIKKVNHTTIFTANDIVFELLRDDDGVVSMEVVRSGQTVKLDAVQFKVSGEGNDKSLDLDFKVLAEDASFFGAVSQTWGSTVSLVRNTWVSIGDLITGHIGISELSGPVGVGEVVGQAAAIGWRSLVNIAAFISISIGIFNLLPFPALDGGRIVFLIIEAIRRKPVSPKIENWVNTAGLLLLFALMIVVTFKDVLGLF